MRGIYKITNKLNGKIYIGESLDIIRRWDEHKNYLNENNHSNKKLQHDYNKYGKENFEFNIISVLDGNISEYIDKYVLLIYEDKYIKQFNSLSCGYNIELTLDKIRRSNKTICNNYDVKTLEITNARILDKKIEEVGGIIFSKIFKLQDIEKELNVDKSFVTKVLRNENLIIFAECRGRKRHILNEDLIGEHLIIKNGNYSNVILNLCGYMYIIEIIKEYLNGYKLFTDQKNDIVKEILDVEDKIKKEKIISPDECYILIDEDFKFISEMDNYKTIREFINQFSINKPSNEVFKILRYLNILEYKNYYGKKNNVPTLKYVDKFFLCKCTAKNNENYIKLYINSDFEKDLEAILVSEGFILR